jgi:hypothetical protein
MELPVLVDVDHLVQNRQRVLPMGIPVMVRLRVLDERPFRACERNAGERASLGMFLNPRTKLLAVVEDWECVMAADFATVLLYKAPDKMIQTGAEVVEHVAHDYAQTKGYRTLDHES